MMYRVGGLSWLQWALLLLVAFYIVVYPAPAAGLLRGVIDAVVGLFTGAGAAVVEFVQVVFG